GAGKRQSLGVGPTPQGQAFGVVDRCRLDLDLDLVRLQVGDVLHGDLDDLLGRTGAQRLSDPTLPACHGHASTPLESGKPDESTARPLRRTLYGSLVHRTSNHSSTLYVDVKRSRCTHNWSPPAGRADLDAARAGLAPSPLQAPAD